MKKFAAKRDSDGKIVFLHAKYDAQSALDKYSSDAGDGPYTLMEQDPSMPASGKYFRDALEDDGSGNVQVNMTSARAQKKAEARAERDVKLEASDKDWVTKASKGEDATATETYKTELRDLGATIDTDCDAEADDVALKDYEPTWPTDPNA